MGISVDLDVVRTVLETDRVWSAFALADLGPQHCAFCDWHVAPDAPALILVYRGFRPPLLFALGNPATVAPLLDAIAGEPVFYVSVRDGMPQRLQTAGYEFEDVKAMHRMVLRPTSVPMPQDARTERLGPADYSQLVRLYEDGEPTGDRPAFFQQASLGDGVYFGIREQGQLVAAAGTLVFGREQSVACIGNVYTRRDRRGRGLASLTTSAVAGELQRLGVATIALNVRADNGPATRVYERLGFSRYCDYWEGKCSRTA